MRISVDGRAQLLPQCDTHPPPGARATTISSQAKSQVCIILYCPSVCPSTIPSIHPSVYHNVIRILPQALVQLQSLVKLYLRYLFILYCPSICLSFHMLRCPLLLYCIIHPSAHLYVLYCTVHLSVHLSVTTTCYGSFPRRSCNYNL